MQAYATGSYRMNEIAQTFEIHYVTVSRIVKMKDDFWEIGDLTPLRINIRGEGGSEKRRPLH